MGDDNNDGTKCSFTEQLIMTVHMQICTTTYYTELRFIVYRKIILMHSLLWKLFRSSSKIAIFTTNTPIFFKWDHLLFKMVTDIYKSRF